MPVDRNAAEWKKFKRRKAGALWTLNYSNSLVHSASFLLSQGAEYYPKSISGTNAKLTLEAWDGDQSNQITLTIIINLVHNLIIIVTIVIIVSNSCSSSPCGDSNLKN